MTVNVSEPPAFEPVQVTVVPVVVKEREVIVVVSVSPPLKSKTTVGVWVAAGTVHSKSTETPLSTLMESPSVLIVPSTEKMIVLSAQLSSSRIRK